MISRLLAEAALLATLLPAAAAAAPEGTVKGRVVVLGFDGADHRLVSQLMAEGKLPNLTKLAAQGSFSPLRPTIPAQTPVSWSTFSTGLSPGRTQIFDFLKRDPKTYRPEFAVATEGRKAFLLGRRRSRAAAAISPPARSRASSRSGSSPSSASPTSPRCRRWSGAG